MKSTGACAAEPGREVIIAARDCLQLLAPPVPPRLSIQYGSGMRLALVTAVATTGTDEDMPALLEACLQAVQGGVDRATISDGRVPPSLLLDVFTSEGLGATTVPDDDVPVETPSVERVETPAPLVEPVETPPAESAGADS